jgi:hypothetical protein
MGRWQKGYTNVDSLVSISKSQKLARESKMFKVAWRPASLRRGRPVCRIATSSASTDQERHSSLITSLPTAASKDN